MKIQVRRYGIGVAALTFLSISCWAKEKKVNQRPNVIYIYADDMGKGMLSAYGQKQFTTPNIDRLIHQGVSFSNAYGCMLSAPARASLLTGYHDCHTDKWNISGGGAFLNTNDTTEIALTEQKIDQSDVVLPEGDYYLPQVFQQAGYVTAEIGKLEWGFTATRSQMESHGWDYYYGYLDHVRCHGFYPPYLFDNGSIVLIEGNTRRNCGKSIEQETEATYKERWNMAGKKAYSQNLFLDKILEFIRTHKDQPFFLFHPTQLPHGPVSIPNVHSEITLNESLTPIEKEYASMVKMLDDHVGVIWKELQKLGIEENTILVFASDNGHEIYYSQKERCEKPYRNLITGTYFDDIKDKYYSKLSGDVFDGNAGMAGLKRSNLEGGFHIPLAFYWKKQLKAGMVCKEVVSNYDILPTMADLLNVALPSQKDGISLCPLLFKGKKLDKKRYVVMGSNLGPAIVANDGMKLRYCIHKDLFELYDLKKDWKETTNVIAKYPQRTEELKALLLKECGGDYRNGINRAG